VNEETPKATDYVAEWITSHRHEIGGTQLRLIKSEEHGRTFSAEFETPTYLLQFLAWDHAYCLDLLALNKGTGRDDYIVAGECDGVADFSARLEAFLQWINVNEPNRNA
jgi:hypothetical protein